MTDTVISLRGKLPKDAAIHRSAEKLYAEGRGTGGHALVRWHVDKLSDADDGEGVRIAIDTFEVADGDIADQVRRLIADAVNARGGPPELPYNEQVMRELGATLREYQEDHSLTDAELLAQWVDYFGPADNEHVIPPLQGDDTPELALRQFLHAKGAISDAQAREGLEDDQDPGAEGAQLFSDTNTTD